MAGSPKKRAKRLGLDPLDERAPVAPNRPELRMDAVERSGVGGRAALSEPNRRRVMQALADGYPLAAIARALSVSPPTLRRLIDDDPELQAEVEAQRSFEEAELRDILMDLARRGDTVAAIFLAKARHGWRDRDDGKVKLEAGRSGVLVVPAVPSLEEWEASAYRQQAQYRERDPATDPFAPKADQRRAEAQRGELRTHTLGVDGVSLERTLPGDLPH